MRNTVNIDSEFVCHCMRISESDLNEILEKKKDTTFADLYEEHGVGSQCASCEFEVRGLLDDHRAETGIRGELADRDPKRHQDARKSVLQKIWQVVRGPKPSMHAGLFALRTPDLESKLVISNLNFPEHDFQPNGSAVRFSVRIYDQAGKLSIQTPILSLPSNHSGEYAVSSLFPGCPENFTGQFDVTFYDLSMTCALRPYAVLESRNPGIGARSHYHDKYATFVDPGYFQTAWPFYSGHTCWLAVSNCQDIPYSSEVVLRGKDQELRGTIHLPPRGSQWTSIKDFFPDATIRPEDFEPGLFYLENPQHVMTWFFWHNTQADAWIGNHN